MKYFYNKNPNGSLTRTEPISQRLHPVVISAISEEKWKHDVGALKTTLSIQVSDRIGTFLFDSTVILSLK